MSTHKHAGVLIHIDTEEKGKIEKLKSWTAIKIKMQEETKHTQVRAHTDLNPIKSTAFGVIK